jgi:hypothetical protein
MIEKHQGPLNSTLNKPAEKGAKKMFHSRKIKNAMLLARNVQPWSILSLKDLS